MREVHVYTYEGKETVFNPSVIRDGCTTELCFAKRTSHRPTWAALNDSLNNFTTPAFETEWKIFIIDYSEVVGDAIVTYWVEQLDKELQGLVVFLDELAKYEADVKAVSGSPAPVWKYKTVSTDPNPTYTAKLIGMMKDAGKSLGQQSMVPVNTNHYSEIDKLMQIAKEEFLKAYKNSKPTIVTES